jgi:hypothetical protein
VFLAELVCSDPACGAVFENYGNQVDGLDRLVCDSCGCGLVVVSVSEALVVRRSVRRRQLLGAAGAADEGRAAA